MGKVLPSQRLLKQFEERLVFGEMNLSEIVRSGAQMMLQYALEREVTEALGRNYYENAPATTKEKGRRNGYESHRVLTGEGAVTVQVPQVRETEKVFQSKILDAYVSRTEKLDELIARMYVHGMSTRDIEATFADVLSGTGVSKSVVSRVGGTRCLSEDFEAFRKRDLSNEKLLYLELDGTYLRYHQGAERKEPILVATGYRADGTRVLLHIGVGNRESYENWKGFLQEMVARGMREPLLIVTDGNPGVLKAIAEVFPRSLKQRCQKHLSFIIIDPAGMVPLVALRRTKKPGSARAGTCRDHAINGPRSWTTQSRGTPAIDAQRLNWLRRRRAIRSGNEAHPLAATRRLLRSVMVGA